MFREVDEEDIQVERDRAPKIVVRINCRLQFGVTTLLDLAIVARRGTSFHLILNIRVFSQLCTRP